MHQKTVHVTLDKEDINVIRVSDFFVPLENLNVKLDKALFHELLYMRVTRVIIPEITLVYL